MEKRLKELDWTVKNRLFYLKRLQILFDIAHENLMNIGKRSYGGIFHDSENWLDIGKRKDDISEHFVKSINNYLSVFDKVEYPKHRDKNGKFNFRLLISFYKDLSSNQIIEIQNFLKKGVDTKVKYSFFDEYIDAKGRVKYRSYKLLPEPFRHVQIRLIYFYRFIMIKLKRRTHYRTGKHKFYETYNDYSNHKVNIFKYSDLMRVDGLEDRIRNGLYKPYMIEDAIRENYNHSHRTIMYNFQKEAYDRARPYMQFLYRWNEPEEKLELPTIEHINIDEANILSKCLKGTQKGNINNISLT